MASMIDIFSMDRLPALPAAMARVIPLLLDPGSSVRDIEAIVRQDEALSVAVLRLANSVAFGSPGRQYDLRQAVARLGRDVLRRCILEQQASKMIAGENAAFGLERGALWRSSLAGAIAGEDLAIEHGSAEGSLAFMCGMLRDIGKLALNAKYGGKYTMLVSRCAGEGISFLEAERAALGFDHAQVGGALARHWKLPERMARAIETHHEPPAGSSGHDMLFDIVHAADTICRWAGFGVGCDGMEYRLVEHVRWELKLDRRTAEREIAHVWAKVIEAENEMGTKQGVAA